MPLLACPAPVSITPLLPVLTLPQPPNLRSSSSSDLDHYSLPKSKPAKVASSKLKDIRSSSKKAATSAPPSDSKSKRLKKLQVNRQVLDN